MKKIVLASVLASSLLMANIHDYKTGFENAIESFRIQVDQNNIIPEKINFQNDNVLYVDITKLDTASILLMQYLAKKEDLKNVRLSKDRIFLGSYSRKADLLYYKKKIEALFGKKVFMAKKEDLKNEYTNPLFLKDVYDYLISRKNDKGLVVIKEPIITKEKIIVKAKKRSDYKYWKNKNMYWANKYFTLINKKAQAYYLPDGWKNGSYKNSNNFKELEIKERDKSFKYARTLRSSDGKVFVKIYKKNVYFLREDIQYHY